MPFLVPGISYVAVIASKSVYFYVSWKIEKSPFENELLKEFYNLL